LPGGTTAGHFAVFNTMDRWPFWLENEFCARK
jgi:hypothetical protein